MALTGDVERAFAHPAHAKQLHRGHGLAGPIAEHPEVRAIAFRRIARGHFGRSAWHIGFVEEFGGIERSAGLARQIEQALGLGGRPLSARPPGAIAGGEAGHDRRVDRLGKGHDIAPLGPGQHLDKAGGRLGQVFARGFKVGVVGPGSADPDQRRAKIAGQPAQAGIGQVDRRTLAIDFARRAAIGRPEASAGNPRPSRYYRPGSGRSPWQRASARPDRARWGEPRPAPLRPWQTGSAQASPRKWQSAWYLPHQFHMVPSSSRATGR